MTGFPINPPNAPLGSANGASVMVSSEWYKFFLAIQRKIGGPSDPFDDSALLSAIPKLSGDGEDGGDAFFAPPPVPGTADDPLVPPSPVAAAFEDRLEPYGAQRDAVNDADKQPRDATLTALAAYNTDGLVTQTAADTFTGRTLTAGSAKISIANGDGVAGNPTVDLGSVASTDLSDSAGLARLAGATFSGNVNLSGAVLQVGGTQVVGAQGAAVADATDAASAITQLNALLARCRAHGLIAT